EENVWAPSSRLPDGPGPHFGGHHVRHVAAEAVHAERLPMLDDLVDLFPGIRDRLVWRPRVRIFPDRFRRVRAIEAVIKLCRLVPIVEVRRPAHHVIAGDTPERFFALEKSIARL